MKKRARIQSGPYTGHLTKKYQRPCIASFMFALFVITRNVSFIVDVFLIVYGCHCIIRIFGFAEQSDYSAIMPRKWADKILFPEFTTFLKQNNQWK